MRVDDRTVLVSACSLVLVLASACGASTDARPTPDASATETSTTVRPEAGPADEDASVTDSFVAPTDDAATPDAAAQDTPVTPPPDAPVAPDGAPSETPVGGGLLESPGPATVTVVDATIGSSTVHVLVPSGTAPAAGFPAVVFAHGFQLKANNYDRLLTQIASYGFIVASVDYPGTLFSIDHRDAGKAIVAGKKALIDGAIAKVPKVDGTKVAAAGHSLGGKASFLAVLSDPSFAAGLAFDPVDGSPGNPLGGGTPDAAHPQLTPTAVAPISIPYGLFGTALSRCSSGGFSGACAPVNEDAFAFNSALTASAHYLWPVADFGHMQFLDDPNCALTCTACTKGKSPGEPRLKAVGAIAVAFLQKVLQGDASNASYLDGAQLAAYVSAGTLFTGTAPPACK